MEQKTRILIVEDELLIAKSLALKLEKLGYAITDIVSSGAEAIKIATEQTPDLILMDIAIAGKIDGIETAAEIRATQDIPIIYLTAYADDETLDRAEQTGSYGYMIKPFRDRELHATIKIALSKHRETVKIRQSLTQEQSEQRDGLTKLPNRLALQEKFQQVLAGVSSNNDVQLAFFCLNLDRFKRINASLGHDVGDQVVSMVAQRLSNSLRTDDYLARLNADEFAIILGSNSITKAVPQLAQRLLAIFQQPFLCQGQEIFLSASVGIALYPTHGCQLEQLLQSAHQAMQNAKQKGGNCYQFFEPKQQANPVNQVSLETELRYALERQELEIYYQPQVHLQTGKIIGAEALLRWHHRELGWISPTTFIPLAEETGLIDLIGEWVLLRACQQAKIWQQLGLPSFRITINFSGRQFHQIDYLPKMSDLFAATDLNPQDLELELTETILVANPVAAIGKLNSFKTLGIRIALDDFGTGYSSLSYLQNFPFDVLKIDQSFVRNIDQNPKNQAIVKATIKMAHQLNLEVIAEGIETEAELAILREYECDAFQGFLFSKPLPVAEFTKLLIEHQAIGNRQQERKSV